MEIETHDVFVFGVELDDKLLVLLLDKLFVMSDSIFELDVGVFS